MGHPVAVRLLLSVFLVSDPVAGGREPLLLQPVGECEGGEVPQACLEAELGLVDWKRYLEILCQPQVQGWVLEAAAVEVLDRFSKAGASACTSGFLVTMLALMISGSDSFEDQVVKFLPDGDVKFLIMHLPLDGSPELKQFTATTRSHHLFPPPFPAWEFPGPMAAIRDAQDFSSMPQLARGRRCDGRALDLAGCGGDPIWSDLLSGMCARCSTASHVHGLPCLYDEHFLGLVRRVLERGRARSRKTDCPHGLLAAILSLGGRAEMSLPDVLPQVYQVPTSGGGDAMVLSFTVRQVAQVPDNYFSLNVPMIDLSPYPLHSGMLRSARLNARKDPGYYQALVGWISLSLGRGGIHHVILPGDLSAGHWTRDQKMALGDLHSIFVSYDSASLLTEHLGPLQDELALEFGGAWRLVEASPGLWQLGEEPYRYAPRSGAGFRVFCQECVFVSLYLYLGGGPEGLLPLAPWSPCQVQRHHVFPARWREIGGVLAPFAADTAWLHRAQRPPVVWVPDAPGGQGGPCRRARERLLPEPGARARLLGAALTPEFDLSEGVHAGLGLFDLMRQREDSEEPGLRRYSDKVRFKSRLLEEGVPVPRIFYMSNDSPRVLPVLEALGTSSFVAKPTHLAATSYVYVIRDGVNLVNGRATSLDEVAAGLADAWLDRHLDDWATESTPPGVIVEALVEPPARRRGQGATPDELKCQTFFGRLLFCEWVLVTNMTTGEAGAERFRGAHMAGDRAEPSRGHGACGIPDFSTKGYVFRDGTCFDCQEPVPLSDSGWAKLVDIVEGVAAGTDHIRIDVFVTPEGDVVVNEANISFLKISKFPPVLVEEMRRRWLEGYRSFHS